MASSKNESFLPVVTSDDLLRVLPEDIIDPIHLSRFDHHSRANPELFKDIMKRAYGISQIDKSSIHRYKSLLDLTTYIMEVLEIAAQREHDERANDAYDDEVQPRSVEPDDGRQVQ